MKKIFSVFRNSLTMRAATLSLLMLLVCTATALAQTTIKGKVIDEKGAPVVGATVFMQGTASGTTTNSKGDFVLLLSKLDASRGGVIEFSYVGLKSVMQKYTNQSVINVTMKEDAAMVDEVIVVGFGTQKKASLTAAVAQIDGAELLTAPMTNISQGLGGRLPGLISVQTSGQPGSDNAALTIRGNKSGVLYIVDGVPRSINDIDPSEIETISLLKDAAATAVYGLNGAGGVMIVTTKKGRSGTTQISYKGSVGASMNTAFPEYLDGPGYAYWYNQALILDGQDPIFSRKHFELMTNGDDSDGWGNTNWVDKVFGTGTTHQHNVSATGGNETSSYFASLGYMNQTGNIKNFDYDRYNLRLNVESKFARNLTFNLGVGGQISDRKSPGYSAGGTSGTEVSEADAPWLSIAEQAAFAHPYLPMTIDGMPVASRNAYSNPINPIAATERSGYNKNHNLSVQTTAALRWDLPWIKGLNVKFQGSYDYSTTKGVSHAIPYDLMLASLPSSMDNDIIKYTKTVDARGNAKNALSRSHSSNQRITSQTSINYANKFGLHSVGGLLLLETNDYKTDRLGGKVENIPFDELPELDYGNLIQKLRAVSGGSTNSRRAGMVFRANYNYDERYLAELSGRYDGTYKFGEEAKRWDFFPAVSVAWRMSKEKFFEPLRPVVDEFKIKASFGEVGDDYLNDKEYMYLSTISTAIDPVFVMGGAGQNGFYTSAVANPWLTWEVSRTYNVGFEASLWNGKLGIDFDFFYNYIYNILSASTGYPASMGGYFPTYVNNNAQDVKGVDMKLSHRNQVGEFTYGAVFNFTFARSRWLRYQDSPNIPDYQKVTGKSRYSMKGFIAEGLFQSEDEINNSPYITGSRPRVGDIKYRDLNGDGVISHDKDNTYIGRGLRPEINAGLNLFGAWKGIDIDLMFIGATRCDVALQGTYYNSNESHTNYTKPFRAGGNSPRYLVEQAWRPDNPGGQYPRLSINAPNTNNSYNSNYWYRDGKYLRLKSAQIGYTIPKKWTEKISVSKLRVYIEGANLFTLSNLPEGVDPETPNVSNGYYPQQRTIMGGISLAF